MPNNKRDLSLDMTGLELPVSGDLRYSSGPSGSILEANIKKHFETKFSSKFDCFRTKENVMLPASTPPLVIAFLKSLW